MIRAFLIDDEPDSIEVLSSLLSTYFSQEIMVIGSANDASAAIDAVQRLKPDLIFLDIQMPGENGFAFLKQLPVVDFEIIFVTSHDEFALKAIKFSALDYLLKPIIINELKLAVDKAKKVLEQKVFRNAQVINLIANIESDDRMQKIAVHHNDEVKFLKIADIVYFEAQGRYTTIFLSLNQKYVIANHLKSLEETLLDSGMFVRVNKAHLINVEQIISYTKKEPYHIKLINGEEFEVSRRKRQEVLDKLKKK